MFFISMEITGYTCKIVIDQPLTLYVTYKHSPSGYALRSHAYILHTNLGSGQYYYLQS